MNTNIIRFPKSFTRKVLVYPKILEDLEDPEYLERP